MDGAKLPASGFLASSPEMVAADIVNTASAGGADTDATYVIDGSSAKRDLYVYARRGAVIALPLHIRGEASVQWDGAAPQAVAANQGTITLTIPAVHPRQSAAGNGQTKYVWHAQVSGF